MLNDRNKFNFVTNCCWLAICLLSLTTTFITSNRVQALSIQQTHKDSDELGGHLERNGNALLPQEPTVISISPRLEYNNEWRPVGRGDPLKNDPTYDYSPPALERVRYWRADNESKDDASYANSKQYSKDFATNNKKEILLLGMPSERHRGQSFHSESAHLQPKYTAIRRSYYGHQHQLPTHLMPPPMQTLQPSSGHQMKSAVTGDYRHSMPSSSTTMAMLHTKPYFSTSSSSSSSSSPWMHTSSTGMSSKSTSSIASSMTPALMQHYQPQHHQHNHNTPLMHTYERDHHQQETINQFTYTRPSMSVSFTPNNFIDSHSNGYKHGTSAGLRKPWLHELLQKEVVKLPPKMSLNKYEQMPASIGISTTQQPVAFMPMSTTSTSLPATPPPPPSTLPTSMHFYTTTSPIYFTTTAMAPTTATSTTTTTTFLPSPVTSTSKRLLIPTTSNLVNRPTVAPMKMTTDALFKHYNQPETPLLGPMYLIIEGHSKVKTYGKDELDPHRPKIVPIVPKREPVVRIADPNEKRGTLATFQVKHLHTKKTTPMSDTTSTATTTTTTTTTKAPKPTKTEPTTKKEKTTKLTISTTTATTTTTTKITKPTTSVPTEPTKIKNVSDETLSPTNIPPTGIAGLFNFLDSSLGSLFNDEPAPPQPSASKIENTIFVTTPPSATKLHPIITTTTTLKPQAQIEARIGTHGDSIASMLDFNEEENSIKEATTEPVPRDIRQVFDYDQLPESRLKDRMDVNVKDDDETSDEITAALNDDSNEDVDMEVMETLASNEYEDENHQLIKRIDKLVDDVSDENNDDIEFAEPLSSEVGDDDADDEDETNEDDLDLRRAHKMA